MSNGISFILLFSQVNVIDLVRVPKKLPMLTKSTILNSLQHFHFEDSKNSGFNLRIPRICTTLLINN